MKVKNIPLKRKAVKELEQAYIKGKKLTDKAVKKLVEERTTKEIKKAFKKEQGEWVDTWRDKDGEYFEVDWKAIWKFFKPLIAT